MALESSYCSVYELFLHDSLHYLMSIILNLIYFLYTRAGMYFMINNTALIFTRDTSMCAAICC